MIGTEERESLLAKGEQEYDEAAHQIERGEFDLAFKHFELAEQTFLQLNDQHWLTFIYHEKFRIYRQIGKLEEALQLSQAIIEGYLDTHNKRGSALIHIHVADILGNLERPTEALACLRISEAIVNYEKIFELKGYLHSSLAIALMALEDHIAAIESLNSAMKSYSEDTDPAEFAWCLHQLGVCYEQLFDPNNAERHLIGAYQGYFRLGDNEAGQDVMEHLKQMYIVSNQVNKLAELDMVGKQKRF